MAISEPIFKLGPPDFAWHQILIIATNDGDDYGNDEEGAQTVEKKCQFFKVQKK